MKSKCKANTMKSKCSSDDSTATSHKKLWLHPCSHCSLTFKSGQALGRHQQVHRMSKKIMKPTPPNVGSPYQVNVDAPITPQPPVIYHDQFYPEDSTPNLTVDFFKEWALLENSVGSERTLSDPNVRALYGVEVSSKEDVVDLELKLEVSSKDEVVDLKFKLGF